MDTPTVWIGVGVDDGGGVCGGGVCGGGVEIDPVADRVWLVDRRPAVSAVRNMPVRAIMISAFDPSFL